MLALKSVSQPKLLVIRLSSLGDVVLASSVIPAIKKSLPRAKIHWVVAQEWACLLRGSPDIHKLWEFNRKGGLGAWLSLCQQWLQEDFDGVLDLHRTWRSSIAVWFFRLLRPFKRPKIWRVSKQRLRQWSLNLLKHRFQPLAWRPKSWLSRYAELLGFEKKLRPDLSYLLKLPQSQIDAQVFRRLQQADSVAIMPAARWPAKEWDLASFLKVCRQFQGLGLHLVLLGTQNDRASQEMRKLFLREKLDFIDGVGQWTIPQVALVLSLCRRLIACDTGLAHLAESVGTPVSIYYGPTHPDSGFAPWQSESRSYGAQTWCRPCGKDGRSCHRIFRRHQCFKDLSREHLDLSGAKLP